MVLSNKKLKQKLRENLAESLTASVAETHLNNTDSTNPDSNSKPQSLKQLMDSAAPKPRFSKREKRRKTLPLQSSEVVNKSSNGETSEEKKESHAENASLENSGGKKEKKRKRDGDEDGDGVVENPEAKKTKTKKKKKKKKGKGKKKDDEKKDGEVENERSEDQIVAETVNMNESGLNCQGNGDVAVATDTATKVYVGGIPYYSTEDDIMSYFESCGTITDLDCMTFPESGKFRGIAIISFKTEAAAKRALALDGADMGGLFLKIQPYKINREHKATDFSPQIVEGYNRIYIGNLSWDITEEDLRKFFSDCKISSIRFGLDKETKEFRGYAHIDFSDGLSLTMALKLDQQVVCGRPVKIRCAVPRKTAEDKEAESKEAESKRADGGGMSTQSKRADDGGISIQSKGAGGGGISIQSKGADGGGISIQSKGADGGMSVQSKGADGGMSIQSKGAYGGGMRVQSKGADDGMSTLSKGADGGGMSSLSKGADGGGTTAVSSGKIKRRTCYECGQKGHLSSACPNKQAADSSNPNAS